MEMNDEEYRQGVRNAKILTAIAIITAVIIGLLFGRFLGGV